MRSPGWSPSLRLFALLPVSLLLVLGSAPAAAQDAPGMEPADTPESARVDSLFAEWEGLDRPGAAVAVLKDGRIVLERGYGSAQLEHEVPITPRTVFHVASVTKQFIAFGVALLAERGRVSLDDDVRAHLPEVPDLGATVTLRHLIHHTSGVRDQWELLAMAGWRLDDVITTEHVLGLMARQRELNFPPGSEYLYSNMGYTLLAEVISRAGGKPFPEWMEENVFRPLGMESTHLHVDHEHLVPGRAYSYSPAGGDSDAEWENAVLSYAVAGATSLFTTAGDLARWLRNFETAEVGGRAVIGQMHQRGVLTDGDTISYAFAIGRGEHRGRETWGHSGGDAGFRSHVIRFPEERLGVVVLSNAGTFDPGRMARRVADVYLGGEDVAEGDAERGDTEEEAAEAATAEEEPDRASEVRVPGRILATYAGRYDVDGIGVVTIERDGDRLVLDAGGPPLEMVALSDTSFHVPGPDAEVVFEREGGRVARIVVRTASGELAGPRMETVQLGPEELDAYTGVYYSPELETLYRITVEEDGLLARHKRHGDLPLEAAGPDAFTGPRWFFRKLEFSRDDAGEIEGFRLSGGRVRNLRFVRLGEGALP